MRQEPCRVYGHLCPAHGAMRDAVNAVLADWACAPCAELQDTEQGEAVLALDFEGAAFPLAELAEALNPWLTAASSGRIDLCDMEAWTLTRLSISGTTTRLSTADLNNVLAYSGH